MSSYISGGPSAQEGLKLVLVRLTSAGITNGCLFFFFEWKQNSIPLGWEREAEGGTI